LRAAPQAEEAGRACARRMSVDQIEQAALASRQRLHAELREQLGRLCRGCVVRLLADRAEPLREGHGALDRWGRGEVVEAHRFQARAALVKAAA